MRYELPEFDKIDSAISHFQITEKGTLFSFLDSDDEILSQIALLKIDKIENENDAEKIINMLTDHASETREYTAFLINRLMQNEMYRKFFISQNVLEKFSLAISDVNPKVCRKIIEILPNYQDLKKLFPIMIKNSFSFIENLQEKNKDKNYQYNTTSFRLYWNIFAIGYTLNEDFFEQYKGEIINLLEKLFEFREYTIREKAAYLIKKVQNISDNDDINNLIEKYSDDENFFVKEIFS